MTEDEALRKTCCGPEGTGTGVMQMMEDGRARVMPGMRRSCTGSSCMAWRTSIPPPETAQTEAEGADMPPEPPGEGWERTNYFVDGKHAYASWKRPAPSTGWCGLAGRPE